MEDEAALIQAFRSSDPAVLGTLFDLYSDRIYRLALSLLRDPSLAEDVVQETFLSALTHRGQFEGRSSLSTWLYRIAYNASQARLRQRTEEPLPDDEPQEDSATPPMPQALVEWRFTPEQLLADAETRDQLEQAIQSLPESLRSVFLLRDVEDLSTEETATVLGISLSAAKVRLHRARLQLRERLSQYFTERMPGLSARALRSTS